MGVKPKLPRLKCIFQELAAERGLLYDNDLDRLELVKCCFPYYYYFCDIFGALYQIICTMRTEQYFRNMHVVCVKPYIYAINTGCISCELEYPIYKHWETELNLFENVKYECVSTMGCISCELILYLSVFEQNGDVTLYE